MAERCAKAISTTRAMRGSSPVLTFFQRFQIIAQLSRATAWPAKSRNSANSLSCVSEMASVKYPQSKSMVSRKDTSSALVSVGSSHALARRRAPWIGIIRAWVETMRSLSLINTRQLSALSCGHAGKERTPGRRPVGTCGSHITHSAFGVAVWLAIFGKVSLSV